MVELKQILCGLQNINSFPLLEKEAINHTHIQYIVTTTIHDVKFCYYKTAEKLWLLN